jgi:hypothetical protein
MKARVFLALVYIVALAFAGVAPVIERTAGAPAATASPPALMGLVPPASVTATPAPPVAPTPPRPPARNRLAWAPPPCGAGGRSCATYRLANTGSHQSLRLDSSQDWIVKLPGVPLVGGIDINGGHNVIIIGGEIDLPTPCTTDNSPCHGINISMGPEANGEVYIEGVYIKNPDPTHSRYTGDGIDVDTTAMANLTIQNVRIEGIDGCDSGAFPGAHADVFQPYKATNAIIQVDHLTGTTDYQGMQVPADLSRPRSGDYRNVNIDVLPNSHSGCSGDGPRYAWWLTADNPPCGAYAMNLVNDYALEPNRSLQTNAVWPDTDANFGCPAHYVNGLATWPQISAIRGGIRAGLPAGGDFVPVGVAGINYRTPGYP